MNREEANARLKKYNLNEDELIAIHSLYIILDLDKNDFCKIVDTVGLDKLIPKQKWYERLQNAEHELSQKERYIAAKHEKKEISNKLVDIEAVIQAYEQQQYSLLEIKKTTTTKGEQPCHRPN